MAWQVINFNDDPSNEYEKDLHRKLKGDFFQVSTPIFLPFFQKRMKSL